MAVYEIPVVSEESPYSFKIVLSGITVNLRFRWNWRANLWLMDIFDANNQPLVYGVALVLGMDLTKAYRYDVDNFPQGTFFLQDSMGKNTEANFNNFGKTVFLAYDDGL